MIGRREGKDYEGINLVPKRETAAEKRIRKHEYETSDAYQDEPNSSPNTRLTTRLFAAW